MAPRRPATTGYARLAQAEESSDEGEDRLVRSGTSLPPLSAPPHGSITQPQQAAMYADGSSSSRLTRGLRDRKRVRSNSSGVDLKAINARLEKWADEIASKFKIHKVKGKSSAEEGLDIHYSVFQRPEGTRTRTAEALASKGGSGRTSVTEFNDVVEGVRFAIEQGVHPKMISQGSSGSYFAKNCDGKVVGVFKPKDEEPYAAGNPKWNKWIHRNLFPCFFGRACLIPNLSYVSEAAAYTIDCRLRTHLVPFTGIVHISSRSFHYDFWDRRKFYRKKKSLPPKVGSFQIFLEGFQDANTFLRENPWPDHGESGDSSFKKPKSWRETCQPATFAAESAEAELDLPPATDASRGRQFVWTNALQESFREELEKLVILDYIMRNTDRGLDNWMIKIDWHSQHDLPTARPKLSTSGKKTDRHPSQISNDNSSNSSPYKAQESMSETHARNIDEQVPRISIGAIDNSLSWPWKHPDAWRSFPFGWLFLPVSLIGQPFSQKTREHFLPILTSESWWSETQLELRSIFSQDADFQERMFARQIAVMKGQAWNVVETLKVLDHGPLELTRRTRVCVWDDLVDIPVAMPLRVPSSETRRRHDSGRYLDEMDISAVNSSPPQSKLRGITTPSTALPNPHRFAMSSPRASEDSIGPAIESLSSRLGTRFKDSGSSDNSSNNNTMKYDLVQSAENTTPIQSHQRSSYERPPDTPVNTLSDSQRFSSSTKSRDAAQMLYNGDDLEGDLGYTAAEGMEGNHRKVIVERLETVKSRNPVFTWC